MHIPKLLEEMVSINLNKYHRIDTVCDHLGPHFPEPRFRNIL